MTKPVGVLALQGGFQAHLNSLKACGVDGIEVRHPQDLALISSLIIPGGESTALLKLAAPLNFLEAIQNFVTAGAPVWGTCAGMILLAKTVDPLQQSMGLIDTAVLRNAYGSQLQSRIVQGNFDPAVFDQAQGEMVFIRAPKVSAWGAGVRVLANFSGYPVMLQEGRVLVSAFHPELTQELNCHRYFLKLVESSQRRS